MKLHRWPKIADGPDFGHVWLHEIQATSFVHYKFI